MGSLDVLPYRSDHLALIVPRDHPLAGEAAISFEQTLAFDHLGLSSNASVNALMQRIAVEKGHELNYRTYVSTFDAAYRFIQAGLAVAILPREALPACRRRIRHHRRALARSLGRTALRDLHARPSGADARSVASARSSAERGVRRSLRIHRRSAHQGPLKSP